MQTFHDIITAFGGYAGIAEAIGCPIGTASAWKTRRSIPPEYWTRLVETAKARGIAGVTFEALAGIRAARFSKPEAA